MKSKAKAATVAEKARMARLKEMPCVACSQNVKCSGVFSSAVECHHLLSGNKRRGHMYTIPLCDWHHRGAHGFFTAGQMERILGPSLARTSKKFRATYGDDDSLLALTNKLLGEL